jgi:hypothetical protein
VAPAADGYANAARVAGKHREEAVDLLPYWQFEYVQPFDTTISGVKMSEEGRMDDWKDLADDELVERLLPDPDSPNVNVLMGMLIGRGRDDSTLRVYTTLQLDQFIEVPADRILGVKRLPTGQIAVWIPGDLDVRVTTTSTLSGEFLKGSIQAAHGHSGGGLGNLVSAMIGLEGGAGGTSFGGCFTDHATLGCPIATTRSPPLCGRPTGCHC